MAPYCNYCSQDVEGLVSDDGFTISCEICGKVLSDDCLVNAPEFSKGPGGQSNPQGHNVRNIIDVKYYGNNQIVHLIQKMGITDTATGPAMRLYCLALGHDFTRNCKVDYAAAACLYVACRYVIGAAFLQLCKILSLKKHSIFMKPSDPSLFITKFTRGLVQKLKEDTLSREDKVAKITNTAVKLIASMNRDWMQTGRKPSGLWGAAIYISALTHGYRFSKSDIKTAVYICETTLTKRLIEFENTPSGSLTIEEFNERVELIEQTNKRAEETEKEPDAFPEYFGEGQLICAHKGNEDHVAHGLCRKCYDEFLDMYGGLNEGADPPSFQKSENEEVVAQNSSGNKGQRTNMVENTYEELEEPEINGYNGFGKSTDHETLGKDQPDSLSDIDDTEVDCYKNTEEEIRLKTIIWEEMNKEYLKEQADKKVAGGGTSETEAAVAKARKEKRQKRALNAKNAVSPQTPTEAVLAVLNKKRLSSKVNLEALQKLLADDDESPFKKIRTEAGDATEDQEPADAGANSWDEALLDFEDQEEDEMNTYYNNDHEPDS